MNETATVASPTQTIDVVRSRMLTWPLARLLFADFAAMTSFYLLLPAVPMYAGVVGAGGLGAGLSTAVLMLVAVAAESATPRLAAAIGFHRALALGLALLGGPALLLPMCSRLPGLLAVSVIRGVGFAIVVTAVGALTASMVPADRRGEGLGLLGVVATVPAILALPLGVWLVPVVGFTSVFAFGAVACLLGAVAVFGLPSGSRATHEQLAIGDALRDPALMRPAAVFAATAVAGGIVVTFVPTALGQNASGLAGVSLLVQALTATATRWLAGRYVDRYPNRSGARLLAGGVAAAGVGILGLVLTDKPSVVLAGMVVFGAGFGIAQSASITMMMNRVHPGGYGAASAVWNMAYDLGWGVGAASFGVLVAVTGFPAAFALTALLLLAVLPLTRTRANRRLHR
ncbi:MFS transporter [Kribbella sp. NPDC049227]|uniref:MFS transporter n=1 Tax=Kribbella sp. NPDC049227 TaxID=3364113 RepID=UPI003722FC0E